MMEQIISYQVIASNQVISYQVQIKPDEHLLF